MSKSQMKNLPYVIISTAMSLDGFIDDAEKKRLLISNAKDFDRVNELRETCDAILVGANTIRKDNPRLISKSAKELTKVTITSSGNINLSSNFFSAGDSKIIVYTIYSQEQKLKEKLSSVATIISLGEEIVNLHIILEDLYTRGIKRLIVEGGSSILTQFLQQGLAQELQISIGGFFIGNKKAQRFVQPGNFPWNENNRMHLESVTMFDDIAVLRYTL